VENYRFSMICVVKHFNFVRESLQVGLGSVNFVFPLSSNTTCLVKHDHEIQIDWHIDYGAISGWAIWLAFAGAHRCVLSYIASMACVVPHVAPFPPRDVFAGRAWFATSVKVSLYAARVGSTPNVLLIIHQANTA
jgi:hypothetical protein